MIFTKLMTVSKKIMTNLEFGICENPESIFRAYSMANHPAEGNIILNIRLATPHLTENGRWLNPGVSSSMFFVETR
jgi:Na+-transporting NADH:ubiquinone oxidoreductase subunit NqrF